MTTARAIPATTVSADEATATAARAPAVPEVAAGSKTNLFDLDRLRLEDFFEQVLGEKRYRAHQVMKWIHHRYATDFNDMTDLGKALRAKLEERAVVDAPTVMFDKASADGTHKWLLGMDPKNAIETVYIPDKGRGTLCVSSQVGFKDVEAVASSALRHRILLNFEVKDAAAGTIRADFADSIDANAVHGSDSLENAATEIAYFFPATDVYAR